MKGKSFFLGTIVLALLISSLAGCDESATLKPFLYQNDPRVRKVEEKIVEDSKDFHVIKYGNGVYFFYGGFDSHDGFGKTLSAFIKEHPELELVSFSGDVIADDTFGYFVVFRQKSK